MAFSIRRIVSQLYDTGSLCRPSAELLHLVGWGGRIRTFNLLIQSQLRYRCATPQVAPSSHAGRTILRTSRRRARYSRVITTSGLRLEPSVWTVILIETGSLFPIIRPKASSMSVFAL